MKITEVSPITKISKKLFTKVRKVRRKLPTQPPEDSVKSFKDILTTEIKKRKKK